MRTTFRATSIGIVILVALTLAAPVGAASHWMTFRQSGSRAIAFAGECVDNTDGTVTCNAQSLDAFDGTSRIGSVRTTTGQEICYSEQHETFDPDTGTGVEFLVRFGCTTDAGTLTIDKLNTAVLGETVIALTESTCDADGCTDSEDAGSITVWGTWTGIDSAIVQKGRSLFDDGSCLSVQSDNSTARRASFDGPFEAQDALIGQGRFTSRTTCGEI